MIHLAISKQFWRVTDGHLSPCLCRASSGKNVWLLRKVQRKFYATVPPATESNTQLDDLMGQKT